MKTYFRMRLNPVRTLFLLSLIGLTFSCSVESLNGSWSHPDGDPGESSSEAEPESAEWGDDPLGEDAPSVEEEAPDSAPEDELEPAESEPEEDQSERETAPCGRTRLAVSPFPLDLGDAPVFADPPAVGEIRVQHLRMDDCTNRPIRLSFRLDPSSNGFTLQNGAGEIELYPGDSFRLKVLFSPVAQGPGSGLLRIDHDADISPYFPANPVEVPLTGKGVLPIISIFPTKLLFGGRTVGYASSAWVEIRNSGSVDLSLLSMGWRGEHEGFTGPEEGLVFPISIPPSDSYRFRVEFEPLEVDSFTGILELNSNDPIHPLVVLPVAGEGSASALMTDPAALNFGWVPVGETMELDLTIVNHGQGNEIVQRVRINHPTFTLPTAFEPIALRPGESRTLTVLYAPTRIACPPDEGGPDEGTLTLDTGGLSSSDLRVNATGWSIAPCCALFLPDEPDQTEEIEFGEVVLNTYRMRPLRVASEGQAPCVIEEVRLLPYSSSDFAALLPGPVGVPSGEFIDLNVFYAPGVQSGPDSGRLMVLLNDPREDYGSRTFDLSGTGIDPRLRVEPPSLLNDEPLSFGAYDYGSCSDARVIRLSNGGTGHLRIDGLKTLLSYDAVWRFSNFQPAPPPETASLLLAPDESFSFSVIFCPDVFSIPYSKELRLTTNDYFNTSARLEFRGHGKGCPEGYATLNPDSPCAYRCLLPPNSPPYEICDGFDNDCNGETDELYPLGSPCLGEGVCGQGVWECAGLFETVCSTAPGGSGDLSSPERCDGEDNDCDGKIDEDFSIGDLCLGIGECLLGIWLCDETDPNHLGRICNSNLQGTPELCDGKDNDCDGQTDNGDFWLWDPTGGAPIPCEDCLGIPCRGLGDGPCGTNWGYFECLHPGHPMFDPENPVMVQCSADPYGSTFEGSFELCNGLDDDCDGETDEEMFPDARGERHQLGTPCDGTGACGLGVWACRSLVEVECDSEMEIPAPEACNGLDDDCDGETDETFSLGATCEGIGECPDGVWECAPPGSGLLRICSTHPLGSAYPGGTEYCNDRDDDCDGSTDEDYGIGQPCFGCYGIGVLECHGWTGSRCSADVPPFDPDPEKCDGKDENCDGITDEGYHIGAPCDGVGECGIGVLECLNLWSTRCSTDRGGSEDESELELCDGLDNDCDGGTDEDFGVGLPCMGIGECGEGVFECSSLHTIRCSSMPGGSDFNSEFFHDDAGYPCDMRDDDCDGTVDEGCH